MPDIRIQNTEKLDRYFQLVQQEAAKFNAVYFVKDISDEENIGIEEEFYIAELYGWLIPKSKASQFKSIWKNAPVLNSNHFPEWQKYERSVEWEKQNGEINITFWDYNPLFDDKQNRIYLLDGTLEDQLKYIDEFFKHVVKQELPLE